MKIGFVSRFGLIRALSAESIFRKYAKLGLISAEVYSAGVEECDKSCDALVEVLLELGFEVDGLKVRHIEEIPYDRLDILITLAPEARDRCPYLQSHKRREHWNVDEVSILSRDNIKKTIKSIEANVKNLLRI